MRVLKLLFGITTRCNLASLNPAYSHPSIIVSRYVATSASVLRHREIFREYFRKITARTPGARVSSDYVV